MLFSFVVSKLQLPMDVQNDSGPLDSDTKDTRLEKAQIVYMCVEIFIRELIIKLSANDIIVLYIRKEVKFHGF